MFRFLFGIIRNLVTPNIRILLGIRILESQIRNRWYSNIRIANSNSLVFEYSNWGCYEYSNICNSPNLKPLVVSQGKISNLEN